MNRFSERSARVLALALIGLALTSVIANADGPQKSLLLGKGSVSQTRWGVLAHRDGGRQGGQRPCIEVVLLHRTSWGEGESRSNVCGALTRTSPPNIVSSSRGDGRKEVTVFGVAFESRIQSISVDLGPAGIRHFHLNFINAKQSKTAGLRRFRYQAFAVKGPFCLQGISGSC